MFFSSRIHRKVPRRFGALILSGALVASVAGLAVTSPAGAATTTVGPINFESGYTASNIDGQNDWEKTGPYDVAVAEVDTFAAASEYGFGEMALRASNAVTSGNFSDQTFSPGLAEAAGEGDAAPYFTASFKIGTTKSVEQSGLTLSVSPDDGSGARMSYLRFDDKATGVEVFFDDTTWTGPLPGTGTFNESKIATLDRELSHTIKFEIAFVDGPANDVVKIFVDGALKATGTTWEDYYRFSSEQSGDGATNNQVLPISKLLFRTSGTPAPGTLSEGYLIDDVSLSSSTTAPAVTPPKAEGVVYEGNLKCADFDPTWNEFKIDAIPANKVYDDPQSDLVITISNASPQTFDWASNDLDMSAVLVKGGNGGFKYLYPGDEDFSDTGLHALENKKDYKDISHVSFCYKVGGDTQPTLDGPVVTPDPENPEPENPAPLTPQLVNPASDETKAETTTEPETTVLGETLVRGDTLPRTGAAATNTLALAGGLGLALGLMILMLANRKTPIHTS